MYNKMHYISFFVSCCLLLLVGKPPVSEGSPSPALSTILDGLLAKYDKRVHPLQGNRPVNVGVTMYILSMDINDIDQEFTVSMYMRQKWKDERLVYNKTNKEGNNNPCIELHQVDRERIWVPDTFIVNEINSFVHQLNLANQFVRLCPSGLLLQSTRVTLTGRCPMEFSSFPFDSQSCNIQIESYGRDASQLIYNWAQDNESVGIAEDMSDAVFSISGSESKQQDISLSTGTYSRIVFEFNLERNWGGYVDVFFLPMIAFAFISLVTIWVSQYNVAVLVNLVNFGIVNIFMSLVGFSEENLARRGSDSTAMDCFFVITNGTVAVCLLVSILNLFLEGRQSTCSQAEATTEEGAPAENACGRIVRVGEPVLRLIGFNLLKWVITILYIVFNIIYWCYYSF